MRTANTILYWISAVGVTVVLLMWASETQYAVSQYSAILLLGCVITMAARRFGEFRLPSGQRTPAFWLGALGALIALTSSILIWRLQTASDAEELLSLALAVGLATFVFQKAPAGAADEVRQP